MRPELYPTAPAPVKLKGEYCLSAPGNRARAEPPPPDAPLSTWAAWYSTLGFHLLPVRGKVPIADGWQNAPATPAEHWDRHPAHGIAVNLGRSSLCSLDVDDHPRAAAALAAAGLDLDEMLPAGAIITAKGRRALFRLPPDVEKLRYHGMPGVLELRAGAGHQDVLPPSPHPSHGNYRWENAPPTTIPQLPQALLTLWKDWDSHLPVMRAAAGLASPHPGRPAAGTPTPRPSFTPHIHTSPSAFVSATMIGVENDLASHPAGPRSGRDTAVYRAAAKLGSLIAAGLLEELAARDVLLRPRGWIGKPPASLKRHVDRGLEAGKAHPATVATAAGGCTCGSVSVPCPEGAGSPGVRGHGTDTAELERLSEIFREGTKLPPRSSCGRTVWTEAGPGELRGRWRPCRSLCNCAFCTPYQRARWVHHLVGRLEDAEEVAVFDVPAPSWEAARKAMKRGKLRYFWSQAGAWGRCVLVAGTGARAFAEARRGRPVDPAGLENALVDMLLTVAPDPHHKAPLVNASRGLKLERVPGQAARKLALTMHGEGADPLAIQTALEERKLQAPGGKDWTPELVAALLVVRAAARVIGASRIPLARAVERAQVAGLAAVIAWSDSDIPAAAGEPRARGAVLLKVTGNEEALLVALGIEPAPEPDEGVTKVRPGVWKKGRAATHHPALQGGRS